MAIRVCQSERNEYMEASALGACAQVGKLLLWPPLEQLEWLHNDYCSTGGDDWLVVLLALPFGGKGLLTRSPGNPTGWPTSCSLACSPAWGKGLQLVARNRACIIIIIIWLAYCGGSLRLKRLVVVGVVVIVVVVVV